MSKLSVAEAALKFKVSKEAIHNRIRRGSLDCVIEHGLKYVLIDEPATQETPSSNQTTNDKYYSYIEDENNSLKKKVKELEEQNSSLRDQKEKMLIEEKKKIEQVYKDRDEQLKQVLHTISTKFIAHVKDEIVSEVPIETVVDVEIKEEPIRLKDFLKLKNYKPAKRQRIKNRFKRLIGSDERVFRQKGKVYVDPIKYDYKDLISE